MDEDTSDGPVRRGEVWRYLEDSRDRVVLVISADDLNDAGQPIVVDVILVSPAWAAAELVTVPVRYMGPATAFHPARECGGYARLHTIGVADPERFSERAGTVARSTMEQVDLALRAALAL